MSIPVICPTCEVKLNAPDHAAGKRVKCPKCSAVLNIPTLDADPEIVAPPAKVKPSVKAKQALREEDDEDDRPIPKKRPKNSEREFEEDEQPRPNKRTKGESMKTGKKSFPFLIVGGGISLLLTGFLVWFFVFRDSTGSEGLTPPSGWQVFSKPEFKVWVRSSAPVQEQRMPVGPGVRSGSMYLFQTQNPNGVHGITVLQLDERGAAGAQQNPKAFLEQILTGTVGRGKGTITARSDSQLDGKPSLDATVLTDGRHMFFRVALVGNATILLMAGADGVTDPQHEHIKVFLGSFRSEPGTPSTSIPSPNPTPNPTPNPNPNPTPNPTPNPNPNPTPSSPPMYIARPQPLPISPAKLSGEKVIELPGEVDQTCVGGGGRFLILSIPKVKQIAVLDASEAKIVKILQSPAEKVLLAAGMDKLIVVDVAQSTIQRWSLTTFEKEATEKLPTTTGLKPSAIGMGSASNGPLLVQGLDFPRIGEWFLFDILTMKEIPGGYGRHNSQLECRPNDRVHASRDNYTISVTRDEGGASILTLRGVKWTEAKTPWQNRKTPVFTSSDGHTVYGLSEMCSPDGKRIGMGGGVRYYLPAPHGQLILAITDKVDRHDTNRGFSLAVHAPRDTRPLFNLPPVKAIGTLFVPNVGWAFDGHVFFLPDAGVMAVLPIIANRIVLTPVDVQSELPKRPSRY